MAYGDPPAYTPTVSGFPSGGGVPPRMSLDAVACLSGVTSAQLAGLNGPFDGAVVVTTGASANGDGLGKAWVWVEGDTATANGTTILGAGAYGRWRDATALAGGGSSAGTSVTLNPAAGQITDAGTVTASNIALAIAGARVYTGLLAATGGQLVKVITNTSAFDATFNHQDGAATAANRVITSSGSAFVLKAGKSATFAYDTTAQRWRIAGQDSARSDVADALGGLRTVDLDTFVPGSDGVTVQTVAYSDATTDFGLDEPGDGGGAKWRWYASSTATRDGYTVLGTTSAGRWRMVPRGAYLVTQFGAKPGSSANNGAVISGAIAALRTKRARGVVGLHVPRSTLYYECTSAIQVPATDWAGLRIKLTGDGWSHGLMPGLYGYPLRANATTARPSGSVLSFANNVSGMVWTGVVPSQSFGAAFLELRDLLLLGGEGSTSRAVGIDFTSVGMGHVDTENVGVSSFWVGADLGQSVSGRSTRGLKIGNCWRGILGGWAENRIQCGSIEGTNCAISVQDCYDQIYSDTLLQSNLCNFEIGRDAGDAARSIYIRGCHQEGVGVPGGRFWTAVTYASTNEALSGTRTIGGAAVTAGQVVLLGGQTSKIENGLWTAAAGAWSRVTYIGENAYGAVPFGAYCKVTGGSNQGVYWLDDTAGPSWCGVSALDVRQVSTDSTYPIPTIRYKYGSTMGEYVVTVSESEFSDTATVQVRDGGRWHYRDSNASGITFDVESGAQLSLDNVKIGDIRAEDGAIVFGRDSTGRVWEAPQRYEIASATTLTPHVRLGSYYLISALTQNLQIQAPQGYGQGSVLHFRVQLGGAGGSWFDADWVYGLENQTTGPGGAYRSFSVQLSQTTWRLVSDTGWIYPLQGSYGYGGGSYGGDFSLQGDWFHRLKDPILRWTGAAPGTWTIQSDAAHFVPTGQTLIIPCVGAGQLTIAHALGAGSLRAPKGTKSAFQYAEMRLRKLATDEWLLNGDCVV